MDPWIHVEIYIKLMGGRLIKVLVQGVCQFGNKPKYLIPPHGVSGDLGHRCRFPSQRAMGDELARECRHVGSSRLQRRATDN